jgi:hypothetical protein
MNLYKVTYVYKWSTESDMGSFEYYSAKNLKDLGGYIEGSRDVVKIECLGKVKIIKESIDEQ